MKFFCILFSALLWCSAQGQVHLPGKHLGRNASSGVFGARYTAGMVHGDGAVLSSASLEPGILFRNGLMLQLSFGYMENYHQGNRLNLWFQAGTTSLNFSMRLLGSESILSPTLRVAIGGCFLSRVMRETTEKSFFIPEDDFINNLDKMYGFTRFSYLLDIRFKQLHLQFGPNYTGYLSQRNNADQGIQFCHGIGLEIGVVHEW